MNNRNKSLFFALLGIFFFIIFIFSLRHYSSRFSDAKKELKVSADYESVKTLWEKYKVDLVNKPEWKNLVIEKLKKINLSNSQGEDAASWLNLPTNLNLVIVPDLSGRVKLPNQVETDKEILAYIWECFSNRSINNYNNQKKVTTDKLTLDLTPDPILLRKLSIHKDALVFDASTVGTQNKKYLAANKNKYLNNVKSFYNFSYDSTRGADYYKYLTDPAGFSGSHKLSTWYNKFENVLIIITDGYLEAHNSIRMNDITYYTGTVEQLRAVRERPISKSLEEAIDQQNFLLRKGRAPILKGWKVLVIENRPREGGDFEILRKLWYDWLSSGGSTIDNNGFFLKHEDLLALNDTKEAIANFLNVKIQTTTKPEQPTIAIPTEPQKNNLASLNQYNSFLSSAEQALKEQNINQARLLLRNAGKIRDTHNLPETPQAVALYKTCVNFADKSYQALKATQSFAEMDIAVSYYELASLIKNDDMIQAKLSECRKLLPKSTSSSI